MMARFLTISLDVQRGVAVDQVARPHGPVVNHHREWATHRLKGLARMSSDHHRVRQSYVETHGQPAEMPRPVHPTGAAVIAKPGNLDAIRAVRWPPTSTGDHFSFDAILVTMTHQLIALRGRAGPEELKAARQSPVSRTVACPGEDTSRDVSDPHAVSRTSR